MLKYDAREIRALYERGENVMAQLRSREGVRENSPTTILYSYDAQAGSYVELMADPAYAEMKFRSGRRLAAVLDKLKPDSILDAGIGEATTLRPVLGAMATPPRHVLGFDISLSRLLHARRHLADGGCDATLFVGELDRIALADASVDTVVTFHAIEPNHGHEQAILAELLRVARRHLVLVEPSYELGSDETRARIERLGYVRDLPAMLTRLGHPPIQHERFGLDANPRNEAALIVVDKGIAGTAGEPQFASPLSGRPLVARGDCWFCPEDGHAFPVIGGIPCLTIGCAILASHLAAF